MESIRSPKDMFRKCFSLHRTRETTNAKTSPMEFSSLPVELRLDIWKACWEPRVVELYSWMTNEAQDTSTLLSSDVYRSTSKPPQTLSICRESRHETLKHYKPSFAALYKEPMVYFNFEIDTMYLRNADILRFYDFSLTFPHGGLDELRYLRLSELYISTIVTQRTANGTHHIDRSFHNLLHHLPAIESISIVLGDERGDQGRPQSHFVCGWGHLRSWNFPSNWNTFAAFKDAMATQAQNLGISLPDITLLGTPGRYMLRTMLDSDYPSEALYHHRYHVRHDKLKILGALREVKAWEGARNAELGQAIDYPRRKVYVRPVLDEISNNAGGRKPVNGWHKITQFLRPGSSKDQARIPPVIPCRCQLRAAIHNRYPLYTHGPSGDFGNCEYELRGLAMKWIRYASEHDCETE